jgi:hypothetical protein
MRRPTGWMIVIAVAFAVLFVAALGWIVFVGFNLTGAQ